MKVKILKKSIKEGVSAAGRPYCIKSLYVSFEESAIHTGIMSHLTNIGVPEEKRTKFCSPNEYNGVISYAFWLNCSHYTFDIVEKFGVLDAKIIFSYENKFCKAKIQVVDKIEQVNGYEALENYDAVSGWNVPAPTGAIQNAEQKPLQGEPIPVTNFENILTAQPDDLPF